MLKDKTMIKKNKKKSITVKNYKTKKMNKNFEYKVGLRR